MWKEKGLCDVGGGRKMGVRLCRVLEVTLKILIFILKLVGVVEVI